MIIFRWETIGIENLRDLNLQTIVFSKLNPLAELVPAVAIKFCDVMKETEILFGHVIIEQVDIVSIKTFLKVILDKERTVDDTRGQRRNKSDRFLFSV